MFEKGDSIQYTAKIRKKERKEKGDSNFDLRK